MCIPCGDALRLGNKGQDGSFQWINVWVAGKIVWSVVNTCHTWTFYFYLEMSIAHVIKCYAKVLLTCLLFTYWILNFLTQPTHVTTSISNEDDMMMHLAPWPLRLHWTTKKTLAQHSNGEFKISGSGGSPPLRGTPLFYNLKCHSALVCCRRTWLLNMYLSQLIFSSELCQWTRHHALFNMPAVQSRIRYLLRTPRPFRFPSVPFFLLFPALSYSFSFFRNTTCMYIAPLVEGDL